MRSTQSQLPNHNTSTLKSNDGSQQSFWRKKLELLVPLGNQKNGNCGVTAVAAVAGVHFDEAFALLKKIGGRNSNWKGSTRVATRKKALEKLGVKFAETTLSRRHTLATWIEWDAKPDAVYVVTTTRHVQVVHGRTVLDQSGPEDIADYWGKSKRVKSVLLIKNPRMVANTQPGRVDVEVTATEPKAADTMKPNKDFIVKRLAEVGKTQMAMAAALNIDRAQVTRLLNGLRKVQLNEVPVMARFLDISTIEMLRNLGLDV
jgi:hypothetical protein